MSRYISATRKITVTDQQGESYTLEFKLPSQSRLRAIRKNCLGPDGSLDHDAFGGKMFAETVELFINAEGAAASFDGGHENDFAICSAMPEEHIRKVKEFYQRNQLEFCERAEGWKAVFITLFPDVFESGALAFWKNGNAAGGVEGKS
ncbi:MAG: hypothetical protein ACE5GQ_08655 [Nitrospinales bacterium]